METDWLYKYWILIAVVVSFFVLKQSEKLMLSNNTLPGDIFAGQNSLKRYLLSVKENPYKVYEIFIFVKFSLFIFLAYSIISISISFSFLTQTDIILLILAGVAAFSIYIFITQFDIENDKYKKVFIRVFTFPIYWLSVFVNPFIEIINEFILVFDNSLFRGKLEQQPEKIGEFFWRGTMPGEIPNDDESELIDGIVSFKEISAKEVMTPRADIISISSNAELTEALEIINQTRHSRIPLYNEDLDNITGIIYAKDLLKFIGKHENNEVVELDKVARKPFFIPETKMIRDLLNEFQEKKMHIAIVINEFGSTAGLISLEDIIEEIVGEIRDELDIEEYPIFKTDENKFLAIGKTPIEEVNETVGINVPVSENYDSIGGFILNTAGEFPKEGYSFVFGDAVFTVKEVLNKRIKRVLIEKKHTNNL